MKKKIRIALIVIIGIFTLLNVIWICNYRLYSAKVTNSYVKSQAGSFYKDEGGYTYTIKRPNYLSLTGNFAIASYSSDVELIIWPGIGMRSCEYGVRIEDEKGVQHEIYIDENGKVIEHDFDYSQDELQQLKALTNKNKSEIIAMLNCADREWQLADE